MNIEEKRCLMSIVIAFFLLNCSHEGEPPDADAGGGSWCGEGYNGPVEWKECGPQALESPIPPEVFAAAEEAIGPNGCLASIYGEICAGKTITFREPWRIGSLDDGTILLDTPEEDIICFKNKYMFTVACDGIGSYKIGISEKDGIWKCRYFTGGTCWVDRVGLGDYFDQTKVDGCARAWIESYSLYESFAISSNVGKGPLVYNLREISEQYASDGGLDGGPEEGSYLTKEEFVEWYKNQIDQ